MLSQNKRQIKVAIWKFQSITPIKDDFEKSKIFDNWFDIFNYLYRVEVEITNLIGSTLPEYAAGAYVNILVGTFNIKEAIYIAEL